MKAVENNAPMSVSVHFRCCLGLLVTLLEACSTPAPHTEAPAPVSASSPPQVDFPLVHSPEALSNSSPPALNVPGVENGAESAHLGDEVALRALALVGKPYRYGGADLGGFDCSGLVYFIYQQLGIEVPRTAQDQQREAAHITRNDLEPGDLVFFRLKRRGAISHVGIYVGDNRFVHAPQSGKTIELRALDDQYFASRWVATGRLD